MSCTKASVRDWERLSNNLLLLKIHSCNVANKADDGCSVRIYVSQGWHLDVVWSGSPSYSQWIPIPSLMGIRQECGCVGQHIAWDARCAWERRGHQLTCMNKCQIMTLCGCVCVWSWRDHLSAQNQFTLCWLLMSNLSGNQNIAVSNGSWGRLWR